MYKRKPKKTVVVMASTAEYKKDCQRVAERHGFQVEPLSDKEHDTSDSEVVTLSQHLGGLMPNWSDTFVSLDLDEDFSFYRAGGTGVNIHFKGFEDLELGMDGPEEFNPIVLESNDSDDYNLNYKDAAEWLINNHSQLRQKAAAKLDELMHDHPVVDRLADSDLYPSEAEIEEITAIPKLHVVPKQLVVCIGNVNDSETINLNPKKLDKGEVDVNVLVESAADAIQVALMYEEKFPHIIVHTIDLDEVQVDTKKKFTPSKEMTYCHVCKEETLDAVQGSESPFGGMDVCGVCLKVYDRSKKGLDLAHEDDLREKLKELAVDALESCHFDKFGVRILSHSCDRCED